MVRRDSRNYLNYSGANIYKEPHKNEQEGKKLHGKEITAKKETI